MQRTTKPVDRLCMASPWRDTAFMWFSHTFRTPTGGDPLRQLLLLALDIYVVWFFRAVCLCGCSDRVPRDLPLSPSLQLVREVDSVSSYYMARVLAVSPRLELLFRPSSLHTEHTLDSETVEEDLIHSHSFTSGSVDRNPAISMQGSAIADSSGRHRVSDDMSGLHHFGSPRLLQRMSLLCVARVVDVDG